MKTAVRLVDGIREFTIHPSETILPQSLEVGSPNVREVAEPRTDDDGERDSTVLFGNRAVSLEIVVLKGLAECEETLDELKRFLNPRSRPYLHVTDTGWAQERRIRLRVDQWSEPYTGYVSSQARTVQLQWKAPDGVWEAAGETSVTVAADIEASDGRTYPKTYPWSYPGTLASGATILGNAGSVPSHFMVRLYGPCTGPRLISGVTGEEITFTSSLSLSAGEYIEVDTRERTAYLLSQTSASRLTYLDFGVTSWWRIEPGDNPLRYVPATAQAGAAAVITYRPAWL